MTLYDDIGGAPVVTLAVTDFYHRVTADASLAPWFERVNLDRLVSHQRAFLTIALGGPDQFAGRSMSAAHSGLGVTDEAYDRVIEHLAVALLDNGLTREQLAVVVETLAPLRAQIVERPVAQGA